MKIRKTGKSCVITIPKALVEAFDLEGKDYSVKPEEDGRILILKRKKAK